MSVAQEQQPLSTFTGEPKMSEKRSFSICSFYDFIGENKLMAAKCQNCGTILLPPKPMCTKCLSTNLTWSKIEGTGELQSYTVIHIAPEKFQAIAPYTVGIVEFKNELRLPGMIKNLPIEKLKVGLKLKIAFDKNTSDTWPPWTKYFFTPI
jgi:uncharacterized OB-fold protein